MWDGQKWSAVGEDAEWPVHALTLTEDDTLCAGEVFEYLVGDIYAWDSRISCWDDEHWSTLEGEFDGRVDAMAMIGDILYVGGQFKNAGGMPSTNIAAWTAGPPNYPLYLPLMRK